MKNLINRKTFILLMIVLFCSLIVVAKPNSDDVYFGYISAVDGMTLNVNGNKYGYGIDSFIEFKDYRYRIGLVSASIENESFKFMPKIGIGNFSKDSVYFCTMDSVYKLVCDKEGRPKSFQVVTNKHIDVGENMEIIYQGFKNGAYVFAGYGDNDAILKIKVNESPNASTKIESLNSNKEIFVEMPLDERLTSSKINRGIEK